MISEGTIEIPKPTLKPSPAAICWSDDVKELDCKYINERGLNGRLDKSETNLLKRLLPAQEFNKLKWNSEDAIAYADVLFKVLESPWDRSVILPKPNASNTLGSKNAALIIENDPRGVALHYAITRIYELITLLKPQEEKIGFTNATVLEVFYKNNDTNEWPVLEERWDNLRKLYNDNPGISPSPLTAHIGNGFYQRGASLALALILLESEPYTHKPDLSIDAAAANEEEDTEDLTVWKQTKIIRTNDAISVYLVATNTVETNAVDNIDGETTKIPTEDLIKWTVSQLKIKANVDMVLPSLMVLMGKNQTHHTLATERVQELARRMSDITNKKKIKKINVNKRKRLQGLTYCLYRMTTDLNNPDPKSIKVRSSFKKNRDGINALCRVVRSLGIVVKEEDIFTLNDTIAKYALVALKNLLECTIEKDREKYTKWCKKSSLKNFINRKRLIDRFSDADDDDIKDAFEIIRKKMNPGRRE